MASFVVVAPHIAGNWQICSKCMVIPKTAKKKLPKSCKFCNMIWKFSKKKSCISLEVSTKKCMVQKFIFKHKKHFICFRFFFFPKPNYYSSSNSKYFLMGWTIAHFYIYASAFGQMNFRKKIETQTKPKLSVPLLLFGSLALVFENA